MTATNGATPSHAEWLAGIAATELAARHEHSNAIEALEAKRNACDAKLEKATAELAAQRKTESRARYRRVRQRISDKLIAAITAWQATGGRAEASEAGAAIREVDQLSREFTGERIRNIDLIGAFVVVLLKRDPTALYALAQQPTAYTPPLNCDLAPAEGAIAAALRNGAPGELHEFLSAAEASVQRASGNVRSPSETARKVLDAWRLCCAEERDEIFAGLKRADEQRAIAEYQAEATLVDRARKGETIEGRDGVWHTAVRAIRSAIGADIRL